MSAKTDTIAQSRDEMERNTLRLLCSVLVRPGTRSEICRLLDPFDFVDALRRTVFEEIRAAGPIESRHLRATLPPRMKSRGYPDFRLDKLLASKLASEAEIEQLFESTLWLIKRGGAADSTFIHSEDDEQG